MRLRATTVLAAVIGDPVRHSLSPVLHNAAFEALGLDWAFLAFEVPAGCVGPALNGVRALGIAGLSVTMPHKAAVAEEVEINFVHSVDQLSGGVFEVAIFYGHGDGNVSSSIAAG